MSETPEQPPEHIGRYRIVNRLGAGGMGAVFKAYDEQLDRWVALKKIHPENAEDQRARERLRREARAAAGLKHPAIVGIYDILDAQGSDWIIMELVDGDTLAHRLEEGSLDLAQGLRLAHEISEGLAEAHDKGIVHRDLKAENIIVTPGGHAKILDFGLAKKLWHDSSEPTLSLEGKVLGTVRSMSPEQALGGKLDHRSDLFSLGTLLYEAVTGNSPFLGASPVETLTRVCTLPQPPAREVNPELPQKLSDLIERLLQKDPEKRPANARTVSSELEEILRDLGSFSPALARTTGATGAHTGLPPTVIDKSLAEHLSSSDAPTVQRPIPAVRPNTTTTGGRGRRWLVVVLALIVLAAAGWFTRSLWQPEMPPVYVAVMPTQLEAADDVPEAHLLPSGIRTAVNNSLLSLRGISPVSPEHVESLQGSPAEIARSVAAGEYLTSKLVCRFRSCQATLSRVDTETGQLKGQPKSFEVPADDPYALARAVTLHLNRLYPEHPPRNPNLVLDVREEDYEQYLRLRRAYDQRGSAMSDREIAQEAAEIRRESPRFLEAYLLEADAYLRIHELDRTEADLDLALQRLEEASRLVPDDPNLLQRKFNAFLEGGRLEEAQHVVDRMESITPGDTENLVNRARLLGARQEHDRALQLMRRAAEQRPSWSILSRLSFMEAEQGHVHRARELLEAILSRDEDNSQALSRLAQLELEFGDIARSAEIYQQLIGSGESMTNYYSNLGLALMLQGDYEGAMEPFLQAVEVSPQSPADRLNLADTLKLLGHPDESREEYAKALGLCDQEPQPDHPAVLTIRAQALAHLGRESEAVDAVRSALQQAPKNPGVLFESSLVYALVGEHFSAISCAEQALDAGYQKRWYELPWFDSLRKVSGFRVLFEAQPSPSSNNGEG
ncbi:MAG: tetratricopeptide repeat protein [Acidobacteriota bacterium]|nr:tetratricopeptide repeat protein [Acidobacteriota bacterium]